MAMYVTPFGRTARRGWQRPYRESNWVEAECDVFVPVNVRAEADDFIITALLPGVKAQEVSIQVVNETVTLQGELAVKDGDQEGYLLRECPTGKFYRVIRLPEQLDSAKASADLTDGLLTLRIPKVEEARPRTIKVKTA